MRNFTLRFHLILLIGLSVLLSATVQAQSIMDPSDPVITYNPSSPPASPAWGTIGKWVRTVRLGWNTNNYKCYVYNGMPFRLRFPKSYNPTANDGKKYPILIFFHGAGEGGPVTDNEYQLFHGGDLFDNAVNNGTFDGYVFAMQNNAGGWGEPAYSYIRDILNYMITNNKLDPFHIVVNGLSSGGAGTWDFAIGYPQYTAASLPMSMSSLAYINSAPANLKWLPTWLIQGGLDGDPDPSTTIQLVNAMNNAGCNLTYQIFPNDGHDTWDDTWAQPNFWPFLNNAYQSNPWALFGRTQFCPGDPINITVGVTQGMQAYQWKRNDTLLAATTNSINVTQLGTYSCRIQKNGIWSDWSHTPLVVSIKTATIPPAITIPPLTSNVIPALDTSHGVTLQVPTGYTSYVWQKVGSPTTIGTTNKLYVTTPGSYQVQATEQFGCSSSFSAPYTVIDANGANKPSPVSSLTISTISTTQLRLDWSVNPSQQFPQTGFEVYQATQSGGPYKIIGILNGSAASDTASGLNPGVKYYYIVRAINGSGAAAASNEASGTTSSDAQPPTAPNNLMVVGTTRNSVSLSWTAATDNVGVTSYDIYNNGVKVGSTQGPVTTFTVYNLQAGLSYNFSVIARDFAKNMSPFSNQVTAQPLQVGFSYKYYTYTGSWSALPDFTTLTPVKTGFSGTTDLGTRTQETNFAYVWDGSLHITTPGTYYFRTNSDDGSRLWIGGLNQGTSPYSFSGTPTVNNDGLHGSQDATSGALTLQAGVYPITVAFYQEGGGYNCNISWSTPQTGAGNFVAIPASALSDTAKAVGPVPAAPSNLAAAATAYNKIQLTWTDNSNNETGFEIWRASDSLGSGLTTVGIAKPNVTTYVDSGLAGGTRYYYRIRAIGQYGQSAFDKVGPGVDYAYYETLNLSNLPDFNSLTPVSTGHVSTIDLNVPHREDDFELKFSGYISVPVTGQYTFFTTSDDGSDLYIDGFDAAHMVVNNDFLQGPTERSGTITLTAGVHAIYVTFFERGGGQDLEVRYQGPDGSGIGKQLIPASVLGQPLTGATTFTLPVIPSAPTGLVAQGTSTASTVTLNWVDNAVNEDNYQVYRSSGNNTNYLPIATLPANAISYVDTGLFANAVYYYKVRAVNLGGNSSFSNEDSAHTKDHLPVLTPITVGQFMRYGTTLSLPVKATDVDIETLTVSLSGQPGFATLVPTGNGTANIVFTPAQADQGVYNNITVTVTDQHGGSVSQAFNLTVNDNFNPAIGRPVSNVTMNEKATANVSLSATDQNAGDALTWSFTGLPVFATPTTSGGTAQLALAPGYADAGVYTVKAKVDDGRNGFDTLSFTITVNPVALPTTKVYIHFSDGSSGTVGAAPWNNTAAVPVQNKAFTSLKDQNGTVSGLTLTITTPWQNISLPNGTNTYGVVTGNNSGVYPDAITGSAYYTDGSTQTFRLSGLDTSTKYNFTFFGSRGSVNDDRTTIYTVNATSGSTSVSLQCANNSQNTVAISNIRPNADGTLLINLQKGPSSPYGYINALIIEKQFNDHTAPAKPRDISGQFVNNNHVALTWTAAAYNANSYQVYRSSTLAGPYTLVNPGATNPTQNSYNDSSVSQNNTNYYYVTATNAYGVSPSSDTLTFTVPNLAPVLATVAPIAVQATKTKTVSVTATDPGDVITLQAVGLPAFASFTDNGNGTGTLTLNPKTPDVGVYTTASIRATDNHGAVSSTALNLTVTVVNQRNVYINFNDGSASEPAQAAPWNNMNSAPNANVTLANLKDDSATNTGYSLKLVDTWTGANNVGPTTGNNSGVYPDNVMQSMYYDGSGSPRHMTLSGLSTQTKYNVIFYAGRAGVSDNRITKYTIGSTSVSLNAASNTSQTVQIANVSPDASGNISITFTPDPGAPYGYINAMQLQYSLDTTFNAPSNLSAIGLNTSQIKLNWSNNTPGATGVEIWKSASPTGPFNLLATVSGTTSTYTDGGMTTGNSFFYEVRALKSTRQSSYSNVAGGSTVAFTVEIQWNDGSQNKAQGGVWNSINTLIFPGYVLPNMINTLGQQTEMNLGMKTNFTGYNVLGATTGNNSGIYPDNVMQGFYYTNFGDTAKLFITGLNLTSTYNFNFFGSRASPTTSVMSTYQIGSQIVTQDATNNTSRVSQIAGVKPDSTGTINFWLYNTDGGRAYLNALTIDEAPSAWATIAQPPVATVVRNNGLTTGTAAGLSDSAEAALLANEVRMYVFPNPFIDDVQLSLQLSKAVDKLAVTLVDASGQVIFRRELDGLPQGKSVQKLGLSSSLPTGNYFIQLQGLPDGKTRVLPLLKKGK